MNKKSKTSWQIWSRGSRTVKLSETMWGMFNHRVVHRGCNSHVLENNPGLHPSMMLLLIQVRQISWNHQWGPEILNCTGPIWVTCHRLVYWLTHEWSAVVWNFQTREDPVPSIRKPKLCKAQHLRWKVYWRMYELNCNLRIFGEMMRTYPTQGYMWRRWWLVRIIRMPPTP
jgi:hypothetical protein